MRDVAKIRFIPRQDFPDLYETRYEQSTKSCESCLLKMLVRPGPDAVERFLDVLDRVGHAEAQIALAEIAEGGTGQTGDAGIVEQCVGQFLRWPSGLLDVGENVERALGQAAGKTFDLIKTGDHDVAPS